MSKRKRIDLTLEKKIELIADYDSKLSHRKIAEKYGIGKSTVGDIITRRNDIMRLFEENKSLLSHRVSRNLTEEHSKIDELVWEWFGVCRSKGISLSGPLIQSQALFFAKGLKIDDFKGSNGWLRGWKERHNVKWQVISGESASVNENIVDDFRLRIPTLTSGFEPQNIFNADETGLFFRALPDRSLAAKGESCKGGKHSKERLTVMFCVSQTGEKLKPFVIGKADKPRAFRNLKKSDLPVTWRSNQKAWMTSTLFEDFLNGLNNQMRRQNRKILLFVDNAPSHPADFDFANVTVKFFPPNTTSHLQPLDQGIIRAFKAHYRRRILQELINQMVTANSASELAKKITVLDAVTWTAQAWKDVSLLAIQNCFKKAGFKLPDEPELMEEVIDDGNIFEIMHRYVEAVPTAATVSVDELISFDDDIAMDATHGTTADEIAVEILDRFNETEENSAAGSEDENEEILVQDDEITAQDVLRKFKDIKSFCLEKAPDLFERVSALESTFSMRLMEMSFNNLKQSKIDSHFLQM